MRAVDTVAVHLGIIVTEFGCRVCLLVVEQGVVLAISLIILKPPVIFV